MSRQQFNDGQEVVFEDYNKLQARSEQELYDRVVYELLQRSENAVFDDSFLVSYASPTQVSVNPGVGFQTDATVDPEEPDKRLLYRASSQSLNLTAPDGALDRIDIVVMKHARANGASESRNFKDASSGVVSVQSLVTSNDWEAELTIVDGTPDASPSAPATPAGYIKIAELDVTAVSGMSGSGAVTDTRTLMPVGGGITVDTTGFLRLTAGASTSVDTLMADIDALLVNGKATTNIFADSVTDPAAPPTAGDLKLYNKGGLLFTRDQAGAVAPVGAGGGGGGGGANWSPGAGLAPLEDEENGEKVWLFEQGQAQELNLFVRVPDSYVAGRQITCFISSYSPSSANEYNMQIVTTLIRKNNDAIDSTTNQETNDSGDLTNTVANQYRESEIDLTDSLGLVNSVAVSPGDILKLKLTRQAPGGTEDTADIRFLPSGTEVKLA